MSAPPRDPNVDVAALRRLDAAAIDAAYDAWAPRIFAFLRRLGASAEVAEELVQETFVRLVNHAPTLREDTRLGAWCLTVARNLYRSHRRWAWLDGTRLLELAAPPRPPGPAELTAATELQLRYERALATLPEAQREVLLLVVGEGLEPQEAAAVLGLTAEATRQRLARARRALEEALR